MEQFSVYFMEFIAAWGYVAIAVLMAAESACIPIPSELILGFAGYLIFDGQLGYAAALAAGMTPVQVPDLFFPDCMTVFPVRNLFPQTADIQAG